jgi:hypothetical protein
LKDGGAVFVLIDNIFVVSPSKARAEAWQTRILNVTNQYHATLKQVDENRAGDEDDHIFIQNRKEDIEIKELIYGNPGTDDGENRIDFAGITFSGKGRRVVREMDEAEALKESRNDQDGWKTTFRGVASVLGQCLWVMRVQGRTMLESPPKGESQANGRVEEVENN